MKKVYTLEDSPLDVKHFIRFLMQANEDFYCLDLGFFFEELIDHWKDAYQGNLELSFAEFIEYLYLAHRELLQRTEKIKQFVDNIGTEQFKALVTEVIKKAVEQYGIGVIIDPDFRIDVHVKADVIKTNPAVVENNEETV